MNDQPILVVGVDGTDQSLRAVRYAVAEAARTGARLRLVHAEPELVPMAPMLPLVSVESLDEVSERILNEAYGVALDSGFEGQVEKVVRRGQRVHVLVNASEDAALVVLGHRDRSVLGRVLTSSTTSGVAAHAACPVVCVPSTWTAEGPRGRVVVGVEDPERAHEELAAAFAAASARAAHLIVLHTWKLQNPYDDIIVSRVALEEWREWATGALERVLRDWQVAYPEVDVEIDVRHQHPAPALVGASEGSDLLVIGRHGHLAAFGMQLGSVARTLIREARCPVEIAPIHRRSTTEAGERARTPDEVAPRS
jgi:nucleotide-binding universal stress UspA family protein